MGTPEKGNRAQRSALDIDFELQADEDLPENDDLSQTFMPDVFEIYPELQKHTVSRTADDSLWLAPADVLGAVWEQAAQIAADQDEMIEKAFDAVTAVELGEASPDNEYAEAVAFLIAQGLHTPSGETVQKDEQHPDLAALERIIRRKMGGGAHNEKGGKFEESRKYYKDRVAILERQALIVAALKPDADLLPINTEESISDELRAQPLDMQNGLELYPPDAPALLEKLKLAHPYAHYEEGPKGTIIWVQQVKGEQIRRNLGSAETLWAEIHQPRPYPNAGGKPLIIDFDA